MEHARKVAEMIHDDFINRGLDKEHQIQRTTNIIKDHIGDIGKVLKNIQKTSLSEDDFDRRISDLFTRSGSFIPIKFNPKK